MPKIFTFENLNTLDTCVDMIKSWLHRIYVFFKFEGRGIELGGIVMMIHAASCRLGNSMGHV